MRLRKHLTYFIVIVKRFSRRRDGERSQVHADTSSSENRKQPPLPPTKGDGSVDYDGKLKISYYLINITYCPHHVYLLYICM